MEIRVTEESLSTLTAPQHPVYDCGLAVADGGKLNKDDVLECDRIRQDTGQYWDTMGVIKYRPGFHW